MKKFLWILLVIIIAVAAWLWFSRSKNNEQAPAPVQVTVERGSIIKSVASSGRVAANLDVDIKCKASGEVLSLPFDVSDLVSEGDLLAELDPELEQRNVEIAEVRVAEALAQLRRSQQTLEISISNLENSRSRAESDLAVAEARFNEQEASYNRVKNLFNNGFASQEEFDLAETAFLSAKAEWDQAQLILDQIDTDEAALELNREDVRIADTSYQSAHINLSIAQQGLDDTKVYAPMDGIVTSRNVQTGQIISSGISNTGGGTTILTLSDFSRIFVLASVDESDMGSVKPGQRVIITADAFTGTSFDGIIDRVAQTGTNVSNIVTFEVRIEVQSENKSLLLPAMTADVEIVVEEKHDVLYLPVNAVTTREGVSTVLVQTAGDEGVPREVVTGINNGESIEIVSGLSEGDVVIIRQEEVPSMWRNEDNERRPGGGMMGIGGRH